MAKAPTAENVRKQAEAWRSAYTDNNTRGKSMIDFGAAGIQWDDGVVSMRTTTNKESLTFNLMIKHLNKIKSQFRQLTFDLEVFSSNRKNYNNEELTAFKLLSGHFFMSDDVKDTLGTIWDKCIYYGYSFGEVGFQRENNQTLSLMPMLRMHQDPSCAFWDFSARTPCKIDGAYAGIVYNQVKREEIHALFKGSDKLDFVGEINQVTHYWYRDKVKAKYVKLKGGEYRREDLIDPEIDKIYFNESGETDIIQDEKDCIYFMIFCNDRVLKKPVIFPTEDIPLPYHPGLTVWTKDGWGTYPFIYHLVGSQKLHNYIMSQAATITKSSTGPKVLGNPDHIQTNLQKETAEKFNQSEGFMIFGKNATTGQVDQPLILPSAEVPMSLLNLANQTKQEIDEISGAFIDSEMSSQTVVSGKALSLITQNMGISAIHASLISAHIMFISAVCKLYQQMIPKIITEQRCISIKQEDGTSQDIYVNQLLDSGKIKNNIKDIQNAFLYKISSAPSGEMQRENTMRALGLFYSVPQTQDFANTKDIFARNLPIQDAAEFEKRIAASIDPMLIKYSNGEITKDDFAKYQKQQQQQQMQMQQSVLQQQQQAAQSLSDAENKKAAAMQFNEETKRIKELGALEINRADLWLRFAEAYGDQAASKARQVLEETNQEIEIVKMAQQEYSEARDHGAR